MRYLSLVNTLFQEKFIETLSLEDVDDWVLDQVDESMGGPVSDITWFRVRAFLMGAMRR